MIRHGVECVNLLYPDNPKAASWLESVKDEVFESIPKTKEFLDTIIRLEVPKFFLKPDERRKQYIFRIFNSSFLWHLVQVDESCSQLFREVTAGQRLYLDNNVLYSLVGFNGAYVLQSTNNLLKLAKELGYELLVTTKTIEEFQESVHWRMKEYKMKPPIPAELATIAVKNLGAESFITVYWKELAETGITIDEFISEKSHLDDIFNGLGITSSDEYRVEIDESKELQIEINTLREVALPWTNELVLEHDAFHRVLIQKIRDGKKYNFKDAVAWFLTTDSKLPVYDRVARKGNNCLPFCLTTDHWIQINRPLITRTANREEYEKSFYTLVTQPFLRSMMPQAEMEKAHQDVLSRLSRYKVMNPQLAFDIVANTQFMLSIASEEKPEKIDEKLEHEFLDVAIEYQRKTETLEVDNANFQMEVQEQIASLQREIKEQSEIIVSVRNETGSIEREKEDLEKEKERLYRKSVGLETIIKWGIFTILLIPTSYLIWSSDMSIKWIAEGKGIILTKLLTQLIITGLLLLIPLWKYKRWLIGTVVLGLISIGLTLLPDILK